MFLLKILIMLSKNLSNIFFQLGLYPYLSFYKGILINNTVLSADIKGPFFFNNLKRLSYCYSFLYQFDTTYENLTVGKFFCTLSTWQFLGSSLDTVEYVFYDFYKHLLYKSQTFFLQTIFLSFLSNSYQKFFLYSNLFTHKKILRKFFKRKKRSRIKVN